MHGPRRAERAVRTGTAREWLTPLARSTPSAAIQANYGTFRKIYEGSAGSMEAYYLEVTPA